MAKVHHAEIVGRRDLAPDTFSIGFHAPELAAAVRPGNFVMVRPSNPDDGIDPITPRPFSVYGLLEGDDGPVGFTLIVKILGRGTEAIARWRPGDVLQVTGPLGNALEIDPAVRYLMVAGGTGIAPVACAGREMRRRGIDFTILYGGQHTGAVHLDELAVFDLDAEPATDDGSLGYHGLVTSFMEEKLRGDWAGATVFACGPWRMMEAAARIAAQYDVPCLCSLERYMACGFGVCLACVYRATTDERYHTCCKEGPIVNGREVDWNA